MQTVNIKGIGKARFPEGMSAEQMRSFLRNKYSQPESLAKKTKGLTGE